MAKIKYSASGVEHAISQLNKSKKALSDTAGEISSAISVIQNARGAAQYLQVDYGWLQNCTSEVTNAIDGQISKIKSAASKIAAYNKKVDDASFLQKMWGSAWMLNLKFSEGVLSAGENIFVDGAASIAGYVVGLVDKDAQKKIGKFIEKDHVGNYFANNKNFKKLTKYSVLAENGTAAKAAKFIGTAAGYVGATMLTGGAAGAIGGSGAAAGASAAARSLKLTATIAGIGGIGSGTESGLKKGKSFNKAFAEGIGTGAVQAASVVGLSYAGKGISAAIGKIRPGVVSGGGGSGGGSGFAGAASKGASNFADDAARAASNYADDAAKAASNYADDAARGASSAADDAARGAANSADDAARGAANGADDAAKGASEANKGPTRKTEDYMKDHENFRKAKAERGNSSTAEENYQKTVDDMKYNSTDHAMGREHKAVEAEKYNSLSNADKAIYDAKEAARITKTKTGDIEKALQEAKTAAEKTGASPEEVKAAVSEAGKLVDAPIDLVVKTRASVNASSAGVNAGAKAANAAGADAGAATSSTSTSVESAVKVTSAEPAPTVKPVKTNVNTAAKTPRVIEMGPGESAPAAEAPKVIELGPGKPATQTSSVAAEAKPVTAVESAIEGTSGGAESLVKVNNNALTPEGISGSNTQAARQIASQSERALTTPKSTPMEGEITEVVGIKVNEIPTGKASSLAANESNTTALANIVKQEVKPAIVEPNPGEALVKWEPKNEALVPWEAKPTELVPQTPKPTDLVPQTPKPTDLVPQTPKPTDLVPIPKTPTPTPKVPVGEGIKAAIPVKFPGSPTVEPNIDGPKAVTSIPGNPVDPTPTQNNVTPENNPPVLPPSTPVFTSNAPTPEVTPTSEPTVTPEPTPEVTPTPTPTVTPEPTPEVIPTPTPTVTPESTPTPEITPVNNTNNYVPNYSGREVIPQTGYEGNVGAMDYIVPGVLGAAALGAAGVAVKSMKDERDKKDNEKEEN